jgi:penicillin-binding protein 2
VFQEKLFKFPGFYIQRRTIRQYNYNSAAHVLGDIAEVSKQEMEDDDYYLPGDFIGKLGVERSYEKQLRGEKGVEVLLRDAHGRIQGNYMDGKFDKAPVPGKNLTLSLDIELQMLGERLLEGKIGSIVAIEQEALFPNMKISVWKRVDVWVKYGDSVPMDIIQYMILLPIRPENWYGAINNGC